MFIKLIQPKMKKRPMDTDIKIHMAPPLGLLTVANILRKDHKVMLENENIAEINYDDNPDIVAISVTVDTLPKAIEISKKFKEKGVTVIAGGIHITSSPKTIPKDSFDAICIGDAEGTWPNIIKDYENNSLKSVYRCEKLTPNDIVSPAYDFIGKDEYLYCNVIHTSRGCPFKCDFCYNSSKEHRYINRNIEDVIKDIEAVNSKHVMFIDDNFVGNLEWTKKFLNAIKPMNIKWNAAVSINIAYNDELLDLMKECGCQSLFIGFESINPSSISDVHKVQNNIGNYEKAIKAIHDRGMMIHASFVFGLDGDTKETFKATLDWIVKNKIETVTSHILTPYPGTALYDRLKNENRIISDDLSLYNTASVVFKPNNLSKEELYSGYIWMYKEIYSLKNIFKRIPEKNDQKAAYFLYNLFYRKYGKIADFICKCITYKRIGIMIEKVSHYLA